MPAHRPREAPKPDLQRDEGKEPASAATGVAALIIQDLNHI
jgi:hypothetical protein